MYSLQVFYVDPSTKTVVPGNTHKLPGIRETFNKSMRLGGRARLSVDDALARLINNVALCLNEARAHVTVVADDPNTEAEYVEAQKRATNLGTCYAVLSHAYNVMCAPLNSSLRPERVVLHCS